MVKRIALDIEGTIADIHKPFIEKYNTDNRTNLSVQDIDAYSFRGTEFRITVEEFFGYIKNIWDDDLEKILPTEENLREKLIPLHNLYELDIVTSSIIIDNNENRGKYILLGWLEKHKIPYNEFVHLDSKKSKSDLEYDYYIDDSPFLAEEVEKKGKFIFLYDQPWNRHIKDSGNVKRIYNFSKIADYLEQI